MACHLTWCPACRAASATSEELVGALGLREEGEVPPSALAQALARLDAVEVDASPHPALPASDVPLPAPFLRRWGPFQSLPFRPAGWGTRVARLSGSGSGRRTFVVDFPPGFRVPDHGHHGFERGLVLRGGYRHGEEAFGVGDVEWLDTPHHGVRIDDGERCTALFVSDGPLGFGRGWLDRAVDGWLFR